MDITDSRYSWARLLVSVIIATIGNVGMWAIIVIMPDMQAEFDLSRADASLPYTATMLGFALGNFVVGRIVDRYGMVVSLIGASLVNAGAFYAASVTSNLMILALVQAILGFGTATTFGPLMADVSHWFDKQRGIAVAIVASGNYLSGAIWPMILAQQLHDDGWRSVYVSLALYSLAIMVPLALLLRRKLPSDAYQKSEQASAQRRGALGMPPKVLAWALAAAGIGCCVAMSMPQVHIVSFCADLGYGPAVGAQMLSLMLLGGVASRLVSGLLADRLGGLKVLLLGSTLQCLALAMYLPFDGLISLYIVSTVFGLSQGGIVPSYAVIVREYMPARDAGRWVGFVMMSTILGMALGGWMTGVIYDITGSYQMSIWNGILFNAFNIAIVAYILWRSARSHRPNKVPSAA